jgi:hypothetical protein
MQIHEIFQKRRVNEGVLGAIAGGAKAIAGGVASQLASTASQKVLGTDVFDKTDKALGPEAEQRARAMSKSMIATQAATNQKLWNQAVANMMKQTGAGSAAELDPTSRQSLTINLSNQLHKNFLQGMIKDYKQLAAAVEVPQPPSQTPPATEVVPAIEAAMNQIASLENMDKPQASTADWQKLATAAYDAMALLQFHSKAGAEQAARAAVDPQTDAALRTIGLDAAGLEKLNDLASKNGKPINATGNPTIDGILKAARLLA